MCYGCPHNMVNFSQLKAEIGWRVCGTPANFNRFGVLVSLFNGGQSNFGRRLTVSWAGTLYIHFWRLLPRNGILPGAKFTLRPSLALCYIGSVTARHSRSGHQTKFAALSRGRHVYSAGWPSRWALAHILLYMTAYCCRR